MLLRSCMLVLVLTPAVLSDNVCTDWQCKELAQQLEAGLNHQINPCDNFYDFVCGGNRTQTSTTSLMIEIMNNFEPSNVPQTLAHTFYKSCIHQSLPLESKANFAALNRMVQDLGGWRHDGDLSGFDNFVQVAHQKYNLGVFFSWKVTQDLDRPSQTIPTITLDSHNADLLLKPAYLPDQFREFALQLLHMWGRGVEGIRAPSERLPMPEILELHEQLQVRTGEPETPGKVLMSELNQQMGFIDWDSFFQNAYNTVGVDINLPAQLVQIEFPERLKAVASIVSQHMQDPAKRRLLLYYIILRALFEMSQNLAAADENLEARCIDEGFIELSPLFNSIFVRASMQPDSNVREDLTNMFFALKRSLVETLPELTRLDDDANSYLISELGKVHFFPGYMDSTFDDSHFENKYEGLSLGYSFIENKFMIREFNKRQNVAHMPRFVAEDFLGTFRATEVNAFYSKKMNSIYVPAGLMLRPFFETVYPDYIKYGALGAILTHEVTHALMTRLVNVVPRGSGISPAEAVFRDRAKCYERQYASSDNGTILIDGVATLEENIGDSIGLDIALYVYRNQASNRAFLPQLDFSREQLFFISYAHSFCARPGGRESLATLSEKHVPDAIRVNKVVSNNVDFGRAFKCEMRKPMNPEFRCSPWES